MQKYKERIRFDADGDPALSLPTLGCLDSALYEETTSSLGGIVSDAFPSGDRALDDVRFPTRPSEA